MINLHNKDYKQGFNLYKLILNKVISAFIAGVNKLGRFRGGIGVGKMADFWTKS